MCEPDDRGQCVIHDCVMVKTMVSSKKWAKKGKNGFGYRYFKVPKYHCKGRKSNTIITDSGSIEERFSDYHTSSDRIERGASGDDISDGLEKVTD